MTVSRALTSCYPGFLCSTSVQYSEEDICEKKENIKWYMLPFKHENLLRIITKRRKEKGKCYGGLKEIEDWSRIHSENPVKVFS